MDYTKLSNLIDQDFTIEKIWGYKWKMFDQGTKKMVSDNEWFKGGRKVYEVDTNKGKMDLGAGQIGTLLETVMKNGVADLNGKTFHVKSNGKTGMDVRYFFNEVKGAPLDEPVEEYLNDLPF